MILDWMARVKYSSAINDWTYLQEVDSLKLKLWNVVQEHPLMLLKNDYCKIWGADKVSKWCHGVLRFQLSAKRRVNEKLPISSPLGLHMTKTLIFYQKICMSNTFVLWICLTS